MAKKPTPANDPAALAFSAVEDALKESVFGTASDDRAGQRPPRETVNRSERLRTADKFAKQTGPVANDDRFQNAKVAYPVQGTASSAPTWIAIGMSVVWIVGTLIAGYMRYGSQMTNFGSFIGSIDFVSFLAILVLPVLGFFAIATLVRRAQDLRLAATSITHAAIRLSEPETNASDKVASVGQAVRREVNALGDGLERALSRAGELEVMIHNEVNALERTYSDNESRMRALIQELANQRDSVITNTDKVREAITESHTGLVFDLDVISQRISGAIVDSGGSLTKALETAGDNLTNNFSERTESFISLMDNRTGDLMSSLNDSADRLNSALEDRGSGITQAFDAHTADLNAIINDGANRLSTSLDNRVTAISQEFEARTTELDTVINDSANRLNMSLDNRATAISQDFQARITELDTVISDSADRLNMTLEDRTTALAKEFDSRTSEFNSVINNNADRLNMALDGRAAAIAQTLETHTVDLNSALDGRMSALTDAFDSRAATFAGALDERTASLSNVLSQGGTSLLDQLRDRGHEVSGALELVGSRLATDITGRAQEAEVLLSSLSRQLDESLSIQMNGMESRLHTAMIEIGAAVDDSSERARSVLAGAGSESLSQFDTRLDEIAGVIDRRLHSLDGVLGGKGEKLVEALDKHNASFAASANVLETALEQQSGNFSEIVGKRTREMSDALGEHAKTVTDTIAARSQEFTDSLATHADVLAEAIDGRATKLTSTLDRSAQTLESAIEERTSHLASTLQNHTDQFTIALDSRAEHLNIVLEGRTEQLTSALEERTTALNTAIESRTDTLSNALDLRAQALNDALDSRTGQLSSALDERTRELNSTIGGHTEQLTSAITEHTRAFNETVEGRTASLTSTLQDRSREFTEALSGTAEQLAATLDGRTELLNSTLDQRTRDLGTSLSDRVSEIGATLEERTRELNATLEDRAHMLEASFDQRATALGHSMDHRSQELATTIATRSQELSDALQTRTQELGDTLGTHTLGIANAMGERTSELARTIGEQGDSARDKIDLSLRNMTDTISDRANNVSEIVAAKVAEVNDSLGRGIDGAIERLSHAETGITARIDAATATVGESSRRVAEMIETGVESARQAIAETVDQRLGTLPEAITARADITADRLAALNATINNSLVQSMAELEAGADRIEETISNRIVNAAANISTEVSATANRMDMAVRAALEQFQTAAVTIEDLVQVKAVNTANAIGSQLADVNRSVNDHTNAFAALVNEKSEQLRGALLSHGNVLRDALAENAREAEAIMSVSTSRILSDVTTALGKLNDSNILLQRVLDSSTDNLAKLENSVADQTALYSQTVRDAIGSTEHAGHLVTEHVGALQTTIRTMVGEFAMLLGQLDKEAKGIDEAAHNLSETNNFTLNSLESRRTAMDNLASSFAARADDIDGRMRNFAQSIADTVNDTERRLVGARRSMEETLGATTSSVEQALEQTTNSFNNAMAQTTSSVQNALAATTDTVNDALSLTTGRVTNVLTATTGSITNALHASTGSVTDALNSATGDVEARLGEIRNTADTESQRSSDMLRQAQQSMVTEMQRALADATHRFNDTAQAMRATAKEVGAELEATRSELARGVVELPEETRASAAAMRRVVAEQIEALSELNAIVRAQPASHDLNERRPAARPAPAPARQEPVRQEPRQTYVEDNYRQEPAPRQPEPRQEVRQEVRPAQTYRQEPDAINALVRNIGETREPAPAQQRPQPAPQAPAPRPRGEENGGWLRDVLRNATTTATSNAAVGNQQVNLSGITDEIARAIDQTALAEAWGRYQNGEQNVFSRRIYTLGGQGTYDEVRKKLQSDQDFGRTAQAYMTEFEQLLKRAAAGSRPAAETREILLSDRGKVYTMLAHASGRLS